MLNAENLEVCIGNIPIIRNGNFVIRSRAVTGLLGRNGAGKTTLLRALMGLANITRGSVVFDSARDFLSLATADRARLGIGYMPEDRRLISSITAEENMLLPHWAMGVDSIHERLAWIYSLMPECKEFRDKRVSLLSGGQQKLVALARAIVVGRHLLLLDEPTEGVAPSLAYRILEILQQLAKADCTIFVAESDAEKLRALAEHIYMIDRGEIIDAT